MKSINLIIKAVLLMLFIHSCKQTKHLSMDIVATNNKNEIIADQNLLLKNPMWYYQVTDNTPPVPCNLCFSRVCIPNGTKNSSHSDYKKWSNYNERPSHKDIGENDTIPHHAFRCIQYGDKCTTQKIDINDIAIHDICQQSGGVPIIGSQSCCWNNNEIAGHVNWFPVTYEATLFWDGKSADPSDILKDGGPGDSDYNFRLVRNDMALYTEGQNNQGLVAEFLSQETVDRLKNCDKQVDWWSTFHKAVDIDMDNENKTHFANNFIDKHYSIVTGLAGLDCVHGCHAELHPIYAILIHIEDNPIHDQWVYFIRNWGTEGQCGSANINYADIFKKNQYKVLIPHNDVVGVKILPESQLTGDKTGQRAMEYKNTFPESDGGALFTFNLAPPSNDEDNQSFYVGSLILEWVPATGKTLKPRGDFNLYPRPSQTINLNDIENGKMITDSLSTRLNKLDARSQKELMLKLTQFQTEIDKKQVIVAPIINNKIRKTSISKWKMKKMDYSKTIKQVPGKPIANLKPEKEKKDQKQKEYEIIDQFLKSKGIN